MRSLSYLILTARELIEVDIKKSREKRYDIYKISHMKPVLLELCFTFRYSGSILEKSVGTQGIQASKFIEQIKRMQKGKFD